MCVNVHSISKDSARFLALSFSHTAWNEGRVARSGANGFRLQHDLAFAPCAAPAAPVWPDEPARRGVSARPSVFAHRASVHPHAPARAHRRLMAHTASTNATRKRYARTTRTLCVLPGAHHSSSILSNASNWHQATQCAAPLVSSACRLTKPSCRSPGWPMPMTLSPPAPRYRCCGWRTVAPKSGTQLPMRSTSFR